MDIRKITKSGVIPARNAQLKKQGFICPLCKEVIIEDQAVLDHCHKTGENRAVLHRGCNAALGKIENARNINGLADDEKFRKWCTNIPNYLNNCKMGTLHWSHRTAEQKKERVKKKAKKKRQELKSLMLTRGEE